MTAKELAQHSGTVPSAVVRFCKSIGAKGFSDFKICLSAELGGKASATSMLPVSDGDAPQQVFEKVFTSGINTLQDTLSMIDFSQAETIVRLLQQATRVVFFGVGTSSVIATDAQYRFAQLGIATSACTDILFMNVTAANLKAGDVAVCISHSGNTKATVDAMRRAKKAGAATISVSSFAHSRLAKESDYKLIAFSDDKNYPVEAVSARIAHICILDALMMSLASQNYETLQKHIGERNEVLKEMRYKKQ
jgi:DNA-binding MurR/RpiR family transcriptional regulator